MLFMVYYWEKWGHFCTLQAVRKATLNTIHIPRMDEQVNKVVVVANKIDIVSIVANVEVVQNRMNHLLCNDNYV